MHSKVGVTWEGAGLSVQLEIKMIGRGGGATASMGNLRRLTFPDKGILLSFIWLCFCFIPLACVPSMFTWSQNPHGLWSCRAHTHVLELGTKTKQAWCCIDCANIKWKLWAMALILALLKIQLEFFHGGWGERGPCKLRGVVQCKLVSPMQGSENPFFHDIARIPLGLAIGRGMENSPITLSVLCFLIIKNIII